MPPIELGPDAPTVRVTRAEPHHTETEAPPALGSTVNDRYRLLELLGEGAMGRVYRAEDTLHPERAVALKMIRGASRDPEQLEMFKAEFEAMTALRHPNVASVYDLEPVRGDDALLITLECVDGSNLLIATEDRSWGEVVDLTVQVCRALAYVHTRRIIHFDLKPANVFVTEGGGVKVLDFGLAGAKTTSAAGGRLLGTPLYMAPEITSGSSIVDHRADLYSLGITLYQLLYRRAPFIASSLLELLALHASAPLDFPEDGDHRVPVWLKGVVGRLCAKDPSDRYPTANAVIEALNREGGLSYEVQTRETGESYVLSSRFVGRARELERVERFVRRRVEADRTAPPAALFVAGASGLGKTRLLREVRHFAQLSHLAFVDARCYDGAHRELGPIDEVLRHAAQLAKAAGASDLVARHGPELAKVCPSIGREHGVRPSPSTGSTEADHKHLLEGVSQFLLSLSDRLPYVISIDDLQWARRGTIEVMEHLARSIRLRDRGGTTARLALLASFRSDEVDGRPVAGLVRELSRRQCAVRVDLGALPPDAVGRLLRSMLGVEELPTPFVEGLVREAGGNPFFIEEVMRALVARGDVYVREGTWEAEARIGHIDVPASLVAVIRHRLSLLSPLERRVLDAIAVYDQPVVSRLLREALDVETAPLHSALAALRRRQMAVLVTADGATHRVAHDWIRETLHAELSEEARRRAHGRIARAIETCFAADLRSHLYDLAHHFRSSGDIEKDLQYTLLAAERAKAEYAIGTGIELLRHALTLVPDTADNAASRLGLLEDLGDLLRLSGRHEDALVCYEDVFRATREGAGKRADVRQKIGYVHYQMGDLPGSAEHYWAALDLLGVGRPRSRFGRGWSFAQGVVAHLAHRLLPGSVRPPGGEEEAVRLTQVSTLYARLGTNYFLREEGPLAFLLALRGANLADRLEGRERPLDVYVSVASMYAAMGLRRSALAYVRRARECVDLSRSEIHRAMVLGAEGMVRLWLCDLERSRDCLVEAWPVLAACGEQFGIAASSLALLQTLMMSGRVLEAVRHGEQTVALVELTDSEMYQRLFRAMLEWTRVVAGQSTAGLQTLEAILAEGEASDGRMVVSWLQATLGGLCYAFDRLDEADSWLVQSARTQAAAGAPNVDALEIHAHSALVCLEKLSRHAQMDATARRRLIRRARRHVRTAIWLGRWYRRYRAVGLRARARLEWHEGRERRAEATFARSARTAREMGAKLETADAWWELGRCLVRKGGPDRIRGRAYCERALAIYAGCDALLYAHAVQRLLDTEADGHSDPPRQT